MLAESDVPSAEYRNAKDLQASKSSSSSKSIATSYRSISSQHQLQSKSTLSLPNSSKEGEKQTVQDFKTKSSQDITEASEIVVGDGKTEHEKVTCEELPKCSKECSSFSSIKVLQGTSSTTEPDESQRKSVDVQTSSQQLQLQQVTGENPNIKIPLSAVTLQSILIAARTKSAAKMSPKQYAIYQLSNDIIIRIRHSLQSERDAFGFIGHPITSVEGHHMDRLAWWFWIIHRSIQDLNPPRGYILPALKMIRQDMSSVADVAVEIMAIQKNIHKQLHRMAGILNQVFGKHGDLFGIRDWESKLDEMRSDSGTAVQDKLDQFLHDSECAVKLTVFEMKTLSMQHETNPEFKSVSVNKLGLKSQREFIKSCIEHVNSVLRNSCDHSVQAHQELRRAEKEIQQSVDKLVRKLDHMRRFHRFRDSNCAFLLKKSLNTLGLCFYEYIDMVRFIRKLGRFVLLASEHVLRHTNGWSHVCDVQCLQQLDNILEEFVEKERYALLRCFRKRTKKEETRARVMESFEEYFQNWVDTNTSTVQLTLPITNAAAQIIFGEDEPVSPAHISRKMSEPNSVMARKPSKASVQSIFSSNEVEVTFISKRAKSRDSPSERDTIHKLEEIGIRLEQHSTEILQPPPKPGKSKQNPAASKSRNKPAAKAGISDDQRAKNEKQSSIMLDNFL
ncbi:unnamed protein product [Allacma fusca]|uniref:Uncharacterized protein n=1 Tax=Allacma fusca TaxID=39272 RepID=A0A8J2NS43_9HEXA|nr:unnamed protein product [Allacma fusca]